MFSLLVPANAVNGKDVYADDETGELIEVPAGSPPPATKPAAGLSPEQIARMEAEAGAPAGDGLGIAPAAPAATPAPVKPLVPSTSDGTFAVPGGVAHDLVNRQPAAGTPPAGAGMPVAAPDAAPMVAGTSGAPAVAAPPLPQLAPSPAPPMSGGLRANMSIESSSGRNKKHKRITTRTYLGKRASGSFGLMPDNVARLIEKYPSLKEKYYDALIAPLPSFVPGDRSKLLSIEDSDRLADVIDANDALDTEVAERFWEEHVRRAGDEDAARALWYGGTDGLKAWRLYVADPTVPLSKYAQEIVDDVENFQAARRDYPDAVYDHPLAGGAVVKPGTGAAAAPAAPAPAAPPIDPSQLGPTPAQPLPFDDFVPVEVPMAPNSDPSMPISQGPIKPVVGGGSGGPTPAGNLASDVGEALFSKPTWGEVVNPVPAAIGRVAGAAGAVASRVDVPRVVNAAKTAYTTPVGEVPKIAEAEAKKQEEAAAAEAARSAPRDPSKVAMAAPTAASTTSATAPTEQPLSEVEKLRQEIRAAREKFAKGPDVTPIDPERRWKNKSTGLKVLEALSLLAGTFGSGLTGGANTALQIIQQAIADDIESQKLTAAQQTQAWAQSYQIIDSMIDELAILEKGSGAPAGKIPPGSMQTAASSKVNALRRAEQLEDIHGNLGVASGVQSLFPGTDAAAYEAQRHTFVNDLIFAISGKAATDIERKSWQKVVPSAWTFKSTAKAQFRAIKDWAATALEALNEQAKSQYGKELNTLSRAERAKLGNGLLSPPEHLIINTGEPAWYDFEASVDPDYVEAEAE